MMLNYQVYTHTVQAKSRAIPAAFNPIFRLINQFLPFSQHKSCLLNCIPHPFCTFNGLYGSLINYCTCINLLNIQPRFSNSLRTNVTLLFTSHQKREHACVADRARHQFIVASKFYYININEPENTIKKNEIYALFYFIVYKPVYHCVKGGLTYKWRVPCFYSNMYADPVSSDLKLIITQ